MTLQLLKCAASQVAQLKLSLVLLVIFLYKCDVCESHERRTSSTSTQPSLPHTSTSNQTATAPYYEKPTMFKFLVNPWIGGQQHNYPGSDILIGAEKGSDSPVRHGGPEQGASAKVIPVAWVMGHYSLGGQDRRGRNAWVRAWDPSSNIGVSLPRKPKRQECISGDRCRAIGSEPQPAGAHFCSFVN